MRHTLDIYLPYGKQFITQRFGENANDLYASQGLKGHTAYDWGVPWGTPIPNCVADAYCYSLLNKDNPDPSKYRAVFTIVETGDGVFEVSYGHCSEIFAEVGKTYQVGDILGNVGNTGDVYSDHKVTKKERLNGSHAGAHLHGPQIRLVKKVQKFTRGKHYLSTESGVYQQDGFYYEVIDFNNGYNGCVSLKDYSTEILATAYIPIKATEILDKGVQASELIRQLPPEQRKPWLERLEQILTSVKQLFTR